MYQIMVGLVDLVNYSLLTFICQDYVVKKKKRIKSKDKNLTKKRSEFKAKENGVQDLRTILQIHNLIPLECGYQFIYEKIESHIDECRKMDCMLVIKNMIRLNIFSTL